MKFPKKSEAESTTTSEETTKEVREIKEAKLIQVPSNFEIMIQSADGQELTIHEALVYIMNKVDKIAKSL